MHHPLHALALDLGPESDLGDVGDVGSGVAEGEDGGRAGAEAVGAGAARGAAVGADGALGLAGVEQLLGGEAEPSPGGVVDPANEAAGVDLGVDPGPVDLVGFGGDDGFSVMKPCFFGIDDRF